MAHNLRRSAWRQEAQQNLTKWRDQYGLSTKSYDDEKPRSRATASKRSATQ
jgi:hypothetical protein